MKKNIKKLLLEKELTRWLRDNHTLVDDIAELSALAVHFKMKYGIDIELVYNDPPLKEKRGRGLGHPAVKENER